MTKLFRNKKNGTFNSFTAYLLLLASGLFISPTHIHGQLSFYHSNEIEVTANDQPLPYAWAGGLNNPQFSNIDLNSDGVLDLFIFDRSNQKISTYIHNGTSNSIDYTLSFYESSFPSLSHWALLKDYNCDGKMDIFTSRPGGFKVFKNTSSGGNVAFELHNGFVFSNADLGGGPIDFGIYISSIDIPGIEDIDNDGDIDIVTFTQQGTTVQLFLNQSMELFGNCDSLAYELANNCYGMFSESIINETVFIGEDAICPFNVINPLKTNENNSSQTKNKHSGSSICITDTDQNGYMDLLIGDIASKSISLVSIGASTGILDSTYSVTTDYPQGDNPVDTEFFPTAYYLDVNNDGIKDLLSSPSSNNESEDIHCSYYYRNDGATDLHNLNYEQNDFMIDKMIDVGTASYPHFIDYNVDGKMDLLVSNKGYYQLGGAYVSQLALFENTGSITNPSFQLVNDNYLDMPSQGLGRYLYPTFGDLDFDGDQDMVIGNEEGELHFFENTANTNDPVDYSNGSVVLTDSSGEPIDVGTNAAPQLFDINGDDKLDLIIGERNGNINLYTNIGDASWSFTLTEDSLGGINTDLNQDFRGYGIPVAFNHDGVIKMLVGTEEGNILYFDNISGNLDGDFNLLTDNLLNTPLSKRAAPIIYDLNNDNKLDIILGNFSGGLDLWMGGVNNVGISELTEEPDLFELYPNPTTETFSIKLKNNLQLASFTALNELGQIVKLDTKIKNNVLIDCSSWQSGIYFVRITQGNTTSTKKIIIFD